VKPAIRRDSEDPYAELSGCDGGPRSWSDTTIKDGLGELVELPASPRPYGPEATTSTACACIWTTAPPSPRRCPARGRSRWAPPSTGLRSVAAW